MPLAPGARLGPYEVLGLIGAGGMGEVYKARDTRLDRTVAMKVLPPELGTDPERRARFEREARTVASLTHPHICTLHDVGLHGGTDYLVMELLAGQTLRAHLQSGPLPVHKAVDYATQAARGLAAAHDKGIVHRDLKPENLFVTNEGRLKILDFGLAKVKYSLAAAGEQTKVAGIGTEPGVLMGTVQYMSPEQLQGLEIDHRSDLFSLAAILYEMLTGRHPFQANTRVDTMHAILREEPAPLCSLNREVPATLERIVRRCLGKNPAERFQDAHDLVFALEGEALPETRLRPTPPGPLQTAARPIGRPTRVSDSGMAPSSRRLGERTAWTLVAGLLVLTAILSYALITTRRQTPPIHGVLRFATGANESVYHAIGTGIVEVISQKVPSVQARVLTTEGSLENLKLLDGGQAELALTQNDLAFYAVKTDRMLGYKSRNIAALALLFEEVAQIVVNKGAGIKTVSDLRGKTVALGLPQSGMRFSSEVLLEHLGIGLRDIQASFIDPTEGSRRVASGSLAAAIAWRAIPVPGFFDALRTGRVELLPIDSDSLAGVTVRYPFLRPVRIPAGVYPHQEKSISSVGVKAMLVASPSMSDELVGQILEAMFSSIPDLIAYHPRSSEISAKTAFRLEDGLSIELHPGAQRYFASHVGIR